MTIIESGRVNVSEQADRNKSAFFLPTDGTALGVIQYVQAGLVLTKTSGMGWQLDVGRCSISPATPANGPVVATVTVAETGAFAAGDATRDRIDVVGLQIDETATVANGLPPVKSVILQGAYPASGSPVTPAIPAGTIGLWSVKITAGTSAGSGGWNTANLVDLRNSRRQHAEYTSSFVVPNATPWGASTLAVDNAVTENNTFSVAGNPDYINITQDGVYALAAVLVPGSAPGSTPYAIMRKGSAGQVLATGAVTPNAAWEIAMSHAGVTLKAGDTIKIFMQQSSGGSQNWTARAFVTKLQ